MHVCIMYGYGVHAFKWGTVSCACVYHVGIWGHMHLHEWLWGLHVTVHSRMSEENLGIWVSYFTFFWHFLFVRHSYIYQASRTLNFWDPPASTSPLSVSALGFQMCYAWISMDSEDLNSVLCVCLAGTFATKPSISSAFSNGIAYN